MLASRLLPRGVAGLAAVLITAPLVVAAPPVVPAAAAASVHLAGERRTVWAESDKGGFGTSRSRVSNVWFTLERGRVSEVFYPTVDTPSLRNLELVVTDGETFADRETTDMRHRIRRPDPRSLRFTQVNTARSGRYRIVKQVVTDPERAAVRVRVRLRSLDGGHYQLFVLHDPALSNEGSDDSARVRQSALVARDADLGAALVARPRFDQTSNGLLGVDDGWTDLRDDFTLDRGSRHAGPGNVVSTGRIGGVDGSAGHRRATLTLGFGATPGAATTTARGSAATAFTSARSRYDDGWHRYLSTLRRPPASTSGLRRQYLASALVVAAAEDKQHPGAFVASPSAPWVWGDNLPDLSQPSGPYHLAWPRDEYEFGTGLWAAGDHAAVRRMVRWMFLTQQEADGSFPQNSQVDGTPYWTSEQLDETALPIALANLAGMTGPRIYRHVKRAADFVVGYVEPDSGLAAPYSQQERWENQAGYSPNSIAAQVNGLVCAARIARLNGDRASARRWLAAADDWREHVVGWTATRNGPLADQPYFLRVTKDGHPNRGTTYDNGDGGPSAVDQRAVTDASFLDLVRYGILGPRAPIVESSLEVVDQELKVTTPNGPFWHRFSFDGYGEKRSGAEWELTDPDTFTTLGRGWPLLTGERGEYDVLATGRGDTGLRELRTMARAAGPADMLAEQVWDGRRPTGRPCCRAGEGTRSATPLTWSHAGLLRLAWTVQRGHPVDQQPVVARRYLR